MILDAANRLAAPLRADQRLLVPDDNHDHTLRAPAGQTGGQVWVAAFDSWPDEIDWIADQVVVAKQQQVVPSWSEIAVLTRANAPSGLCSRR